ncbi:hypothetical protein WA026_019609, partial [Henosepilachna vigintioctopunctata]
CAKSHTYLKILLEGKPICCERSDDNEQQEEHEETKYDDQQILLMEIWFIRELLKKIKEKNEILELNNSALLEKIDILVKDEKNHETNKPNNTPINLTAIRQTRMSSMCR